MVVVSCVRCEDGHDEGGQDFTAIHVPPQTLLSLYIYMGCGERW